MFTQLLFALAGYVDVGSLTVGLPGDRPRPPEGEDD